MRLKTFRYAGLTSLAIEYTVLAYFVLVKHQPLLLTRTISDFGASASTQLVFSLAFTLIGFLAGMFGLWLTSIFEFQRNFLITLWLGVSAQIGTAWLPDDGQTLVFHDIFAVLLIFILPLVIYYYSLAITNTAIQLISKCLILLELIAILFLPISIAWHVPLLAEGLSFLSFHFWIVMATFARNTNQQPKILEAS
jgi:hypothetical protein